MDNEMCAKKKKTSKELALKMRIDLDKTGQTHDSQLDHELLRYIINYPLQNRLVQQV